MGVTRINHCLYTMMDRDRFNELIVKKISGTINLLEQKELSEIIQQNPEFYDTLEDTQSIFEKNLYSTKPIAKITTNVLKKIRLVEQKPVSYLNVRNISIAATFLVFISLSYFLFFQSAISFSKPNIVSTKKGSRTSITLPDGTQVWLNADSKISYSQNFGKKNRTVSLIGEAYFDVVKDINYTFIIKTPQVDIEVLGTVFNIRAYPEELNTETTLFEGSIQAYIKEKRQSITLRPNEKLLVRNTDNNAEKSVERKSTKASPIMLVVEIANKTADSLAYESEWTRNSLAFHREKFKDIAILISRWYGVEVLIENENLRDKEFSGLFRNKTLEEVLESLRIAGNFNYIIKNDTIIIK